MGNGTSQRVKHDETWQSRPHFFIPRHSRHQICQRQAFTQAHGQGMRLEHRRYPGYFVRCDIPQLLRQMSRRDQTNGNGFTMQINPIASHLFNRMAKRMAKI